MADRCGYAAWCLAGVCRGKPPWQTVEPRESVATRARPSARPIALLWELRGVSPAGGGGFARGAGGATAKDVGSAGLALQRRPPLPDYPDRATSEAPEPCVVCTLSAVRRAIVGAPLAHPPHRTVRR